ncbi:MAG: uncharacterized protein JWP46_1336 [Modestobacter sp.]|nr:uncharacterized protein [Modestobacter sp.]
MSHLVSIQLDALAVLLDELTALGRQLDDEARLSASTGRSLGAALSGAAGAVADDVGADWAAAVTVLAARALAVAATLDAALAGYRTTDAVLAERIGAGRHGLAAVAR